MVQQADVIVRAVAFEYTIKPRPNTWTNGEPDSRIRFKVVETLRGGLLTEVILPGYLSDGDDFNDHTPPYRFVRPGGRSGSCFANTYRNGAQFLLFLQKNRSGALTVDWYALGPVNEQLHSWNDPWLLWTRNEVLKQKMHPQTQMPSRHRSSEPVSRTEITSSK
jgi:hypothetical protein